jgi:hypothetical protein
MYLKKEHKYDNQSDESVSKYVYNARLNLLNLLSKQFYENTKENFCL